MFLQVEVEKRREEQRKFGVFFDDDYNYLQHLKEAPHPVELVSTPRVHREARPKPAEDKEDVEEEDVHVPVRPNGSSSSLQISDNVLTVIISF